MFKQDRQASRDRAIGNKETDVGSGSGPFDYATLRETALARLRGAVLNNKVLL